MKPRHYYNEFDPKAAAWLRELMRGGHIPEGLVDERSIRDVRADELDGFTQCHFFAGIGGWALALRLAGWPESEEVWTGSCPCQPFSCAGKGGGTDDERHLWPDFARLIRERRPATVFGEQVASAAGRDWIAGVFADLERMDYRGAGSDLPAAGIGQKAFRGVAAALRHAVQAGDPRVAGRERDVLALAEHLDGLIVGAPHIRQRLFWVADTLRGQCSPRGGGHPRQAGAQPEVGPDAHGRGGEHHRRLADPAGVRGAEHGQEPGRWGPAQPVDTAERGRIDGGLEHALGTGLEGHPGHGHHGHESGRHGAQPAGPVAPASGLGVAADTAGDHRSAWLYSALVPCADGATRRFEPRAFPLADGVSARVGRLRGYGNAIVPPLAAEFIAAYCEARG